MLRYSDVLCQAIASDQRRPTPPLMLAPTPFSAYAVHAPLSRPLLIFPDSYAPCRRLPPVFFPEAPEIRWFSTDIFMMAICFELVRYVFHYAIALPSQRCRSAPPPRHCLEPLPRLIYDSPRIDARCRRAAMMIMRCQRHAAAMSRRLPRDEILPLFAAAFAAPARCCRQRAPFAAHLLYFAMRHHFETPEGAFCALPYPASRHARRDLPVPRQPPDLRFRATALLTPHGMPSAFMPFARCRHAHADGASLLSCIPSARLCETRPRLQEIC